MVNTCAWVKCTIKSQTKKSIWFTLGSPIWGYSKIVWTLFHALLVSYRRLSWRMKKIVSEQFLHCCSLISRTFFSKFTNRSLFFKWMAYMHFRGYIHSSFGHIHPILLIIRNYRAITCLLINFRSLSTCSWLSSWMISIVLFMGSPNSFENQQFSTSYQSLIWLWYV